MQKVKIIFLFLLALPAFSQRTAAQGTDRMSTTYLQKLADEVCSTITKRVTGSTTPEEGKHIILTSMTDVLPPHLEGIEDSLHVNMSDQAAAREFGFRLGSELEKGCPAYQHIFSMEAQEIAVKKTFMNEQIITAEGKFSGIESGKLAFVNIIDKNGQKISFLWLNYFKGAELLQNKPDQLKGKKVIVEYKEIECYVPKANDYYKVKQIVGLSVL